MIENRHFLKFIGICVFLSGTLLFSLPAHSEVVVVYGRVMSNSVVKKKGKEKGIQLELSYEHEGKLVTTSVFLSASKDKYKEKKRELEKGPTAKFKIDTAKKVLHDVNDVSEIKVSYAEALDEDLSIPVEFDHVDSHVGSKDEYVIYR